MAGDWDERRAHEWPIESLSAWAAAVVEEVENRGGDGDSAYCSMYELADTLGMWEWSTIRAPGQLWTERDLRETRRRYAHLLEPMRRSADRIPGQPAWMTIQLVDLLCTEAGLPTLSRREVDRRTRYCKLVAAAERMIQTQFSVSMPAYGDDTEDSRRPETADEPISGLTDTESVRPRTLEEVADDLREEAGRADLPDPAVDMLVTASTLIHAGEVGAALTMLDQVVDRLYEEMGRFGDFRSRLAD